MEKDRNDIPRSDRVVALIFRAWSRIYDKPVFQKPFYRRVHAAVLRAIDEAAVAPRRVLDVGCGTAQLTADLAAKFPGAQAIGLDMSAGMLAQARQRVPRLLRANVYGLPVGEAAIDLVTSTISYHWYLEPERALAEIHRVLAPGGVLVLATMVTWRVRAALARQRLVPEADHLRDLDRAGFAVAGSARVWPNVRVFTARRR